MSELLRGRLDLVFRSRAHVVRNIVMDIAGMEMDPSLDVYATCLDIFPSRGNRRVLGGVGTGRGAVHFSLNEGIEGRLHVVPRLHFFLSSDLSCLRHVSRLLGGWGDGGAGRFSVLCYSRMSLFRRRCAHCRYSRLRLYS